MQIRVSARTLMKIGIFVVIYTGFGGTYYFMQNRLQELGFALLILLFLYTAVLSALNNHPNSINWSRWFFLTLFLITYMMTVPAFVFAGHFNVPALPSVLASREFLAILFAPVLYFSYRSGLTPSEIERVICFSFGAIILSYLFHYFRIDLEAAYRSPIAAINGMVTHDDWRGYRLKGPNVALVFCTLISPLLLYRATIRLERLFWMTVFCVTLWSWGVLQARSLMAAVFVSTFLYHAWFARPTRLPLFYLGAPILLTILAFIIYKFVTDLSSIDPVRYRSFSQAVEFLSNNPILGFGKDSAATLKEQQLMNPWFYSSDIGIVGAAFRIGIFGAIALVVTLIATLTRTIRTNWLFFRHERTVNVIFLFFIIKTTGDLINIFLSAVGYLKIGGILSLGMAIGLTSIYRHYYCSKKSLYFINNQLGNGCSAPKPVS